MSPALFGVALAAALGAGLNGGVFFAFSGFVMPALQRLPAAQGIAAMQSITSRRCARRSWWRCSGRRRSASC
jgi:uncharacterized membrane protein